MDKGPKCTICGDHIISGKCHCEKCYISERQNWRKSVRKHLKQIKKLEDAKREVFKYLEERYLSSSSMGEIEVLWDETLKALG